MISVKKDQINKLIFNRKNNQELGPSKQISTREDLTTKVISMS